MGRRHLAAIDVFVASRCRAVDALACCTRPDNSGRTWQQYAEASKEAVWVDEAMAHPAHVMGMVNGRYVAGSPVVWALRTGDECTRERCRGEARG
jgi:hypothetical protein